MIQTTKTSATAPEVPALNFVRWDMPGRRTVTLWDR